MDGSEASFMAGFSSLALIVPGRFTLVLLLKHFIKLSWFSRSVALILSTSHHLSKTFDL
jgi:hypothetical protein